MKTQTNIKNAALKAGILFFFLTIISVNLINGQTRQNQEQYANDSEVMELRNWMFESLWYETENQTEIREWMTVIDFSENSDEELLAIRDWMISTDENSIFISNHLPANADLFTFVNP